jgi:hypothetical protein
MTTDKVYRRKQGPGEADRDFTLDKLMHVAMRRVTA